MTKRNIGIATFAGIVILVGLLIAYGSNKPTRSAPVVVTSPKERASVGSPPATVANDKGSDSRSLWVRPSAAIAARQYRRQGFAWILRQLGANEALLDRLADGNLPAVLTDLKAQAQKGDPTAINILGEIAYQQCSLGRTADTIASFETSQLLSARSLPPADSQWFDAAVHDDSEFDKQMKAACTQIIDVDQVLSWVENNAKQGDGASLWLLSMTGNNLQVTQQRLRAAAAAGFPEAQFELA